MSFRLRADERLTLEALCETFFPRLKGDADPDGLLGRSAADLNLAEELGATVEQLLGEADQAAFRRLLHSMESPALNLLLSARPVRFSGLTPHARERYLKGWALSRWPLKRRAFHALKRLTLFLAYAGSSEPGPNPNWAAIGYPGPSFPTAGPPSEIPLPPARPDASGELRCDVVVVGSGAGGSVIASELAARGRSVVVVEEGPFRTEGQFRGLEAEADRELFQRHGLFTTRDGAFGLLAGRCAGGGTTVNWMTCLRPLPLARAEWEAAGWEGVNGPEFDSDLDFVWGRLGVSYAESTVNPANEVLRRGARALGYREGPDYEVIPRNATGCRNRCDFCAFGCRYGARNGVARTFLLDAQAHGTRFLFDTRVDSIEHARGTISGVFGTQRSDGRPRPVHLRCAAVVLAAGALQSPAVLLRSGIRGGAIGRGLRLDPTVALVGEFAEPIRTWAGPMQTIRVHRQQRESAGAHGAWLESVPAHPGLAALALPWYGGAEHKSLMRAFARVAATIALVRDTGAGRVRIDARGESVVDYRLDAEDRKHLIEGLVEAARIHAAAGALRVRSLHARPIWAGDGRTPVSPEAISRFAEELRAEGIAENSVALFSAHPLGSLPGGSDPRRHPATPSGALRAVEGLWVGDGSLLPTAPGVNPMITIMAVARRVARGIEDELGGRAGPPREEAPHKAL